MRKAAALALRQSAPRSRVAWVLEGYLRQPSKVGNYFGKHHHATIIKACKITGYQSASAYTFGRHAGYVAKPSKKRGYLLGRRQAVSCVELMMRQTDGHPSLTTTETSFDYAGSYVVIPNSAYLAASADPAADPLNFEAWFLCPT